MRRVAVASAGSTVAVLALALAAHAAQQPSFPSKTEIVRLDVVVIDHAGHPVKGLSADEFEIVEEGRPRSIESFEPIVVGSPGSGAESPAPSVSARTRQQDPHEGRCVLIFFDDVHISPPAAEQVRSQLTHFLAHSVRDGDWVTLVAPQADVWWTARTAWEHEQLPAVIAGLSGFLARDIADDEQSSDYKAMRAVEYGSRTGAGVESRQDPTAVVAAAGTLTAIMPPPRRLHSA